MARSPSYPGINLEEALERAQTLYQHERRNAAPVDAVLAHWGYRPGTGVGRIALAALKKFGLIEDEGSSDRRLVKLSDLALRILLDDREDPSERLVAIQEAAMLPPIHSELRQKFPDGPPSDATLRHYLLFERRFTESGAQDLIREYKETLSFASLDGTATIPSYEMATPRPQTAQLASASAPFTPRSMSAQAGAPDLRGAGIGHTASASNQTLTVPIGGGRFAFLSMPYPMTESDWTQFEAVLAAMKPGIVETAPPLAIAAPADHKD
jgi:hypothetical protein